jgi:ribosomal protein L1
MCGNVKTTIEVMNFKKRILGPKGLMPNEKLGTLIKVENLEKAIFNAKHG